MYLLFNVTFIMSLFSIVINVKCANKYNEFNNNTSIINRFKNDEGNLNLKTESPLITTVTEYDSIMRMISTYEYCLIYSYNSNNVNKTNLDLYKNHLGTIQSLEDSLMINPYINNNRIRMFLIDSSSNNLKDFIKNYDINENISILCFYRGGLTSKFKVTTQMQSSEILNVLYKAFSFDTNTSTIGKKRWSRKQSKYIIENNCPNEEKTYLVRNVNNCCACNDSCYSNTRVGINFGFYAPYNDWWWPGYGFGYNGGYYYGAGHRRGIAHGGGHEWHRNGSRYRH